MKKQLLFLAFAALLAGCNKPSNTGGTSSDTTTSGGYGTRSDQGSSITLTNSSTNRNTNANSGGTSSSSGTSSGTSSSSSSDKSSSGNSTSGNSSSSDKGQ